MEKKDRRLIKLNKVSFYYNDYMVFNNLNFIINRGDRISILGKSGTGKSTLLKLLSGLLKPKLGSIDIADNIKFSFLFQDNTLLPWMTILNNIKFFSKQSDDYIKTILTSLKIKNVVDKYPDTLSGGMLQRANLACSLATNPDVLLMDEPFSSLDYITKLDNYNFLLDQINKSNITTIMVTHDINEAILFSKCIYIISESTGNLVYKINIDESLNNSKMMTNDDFVRKYNSILDIIKS